MSIWSPNGVLALLALVSAGPALAQQSELPVGSGEDIIRLVRRVDFRVEANSAGETDELRFTLRHDQRIELGDGWRVNLRVDAPLVFARELDEAGGHHNTSGLGDVLLQAIFVHLRTTNQGFGIGAQLIMPTAGGDALGTGKWRIRPTAGYRWPLTSISETSFFQLIARYDFSFAGDDDRRDVRQLQVAPNLEIGLEGNAYVSFFPSTDIRYNFVRDELFVPINVEVGKEWGKLVASLEGGAGVIKGDHPPYDWKVEGRLGLRF